ncbi:nucleoside-diphosphate sugar epimerase [Acinetobacter bereziniae]|uniref:nucleoside-diphosphate sugar epimerase n=1 Tax=Acinetobacter bereziniae TaxID=106648 RepID=UPI0015805E88|nr:nucleoside-diphosphate sugar epimerase [Acinetobacter bereziniae]NUF65163.1 nucleoside-diphosphate sugar epimerase [Acinetobacter bereziniae]NUG09057.1 nucleoside-diphosphate sugar epimerase [Acinetobacter bereziniae]NUG62767.1 nucleoside-diphosphate sugar epimerase [Acinetobacter bereziniae]NUG68859.1 nucleoside-diphosphate sugar epimerase [Acinetobacter bereziniae]NUG81142.1 nucleoside-diphosphate sugar epimerase [Acinetobacter bereziniae]
MTNSIKNAIVIGATGLVGQCLIEQLNSLAECEKITVIVRRQIAEFNSYKKVEQFVLEDFLLLNDQDVNGYSHAFSCLGSTIKKAGSKEAFYNIDFEINAHFADLFETTDTHLILVSAMGANAGSPIFYNRVKGELEAYIQKLDLYRFSIIRPSLLLGERNEKRFFEDVSQKFYRRFSHWVPNSFKYKPVTAQQVAHTMVEAAQTQTQKIEIYDNLHIQNA